MENYQENWKKLVREIGEDAARKKLATWLRKAADQVEKKNYPDVFGCQIPDREPDVPCKGEDFIETFSVTLSHLWPG